MGIMGPKGKKKKVEISALVETFDPRLSLHAV